MPSPSPNPAGAVRRVVPAVLLISLLGSAQQALGLQDELGAQDDAVHTPVERPGWVVAAASTAAFCGAAACSASVPVVVGGGIGSLAVLDTTLRAQRGMGTHLLWWGLWMLFFVLASSPVAPLLFVAAETLLFAVTSAAASRRQPARTRMVIVGSALFSAVAASIGAAVVAATAVALAGALVTITLTAAGPSPVWSWWAVIAVRPERGTAFVLGGWAVFLTLFTLACVTPVLLRTVGLGHLASRDVDGA